jgi:anti-sigma factor RsiW
MRGTIHRDAELLRLLCGELGEEEAERLRAELGRDCELAKRLAAFEAVWSNLRQPAAAPLTASLDSRLEECLSSERRSELRLASAPRLLQAVSPALLVAGVLLGFLLPLSFEGEEELDPLLVMTQPTLAELYTVELEMADWDVVAEPESAQ